MPEPMKVLFFSNLRWTALFQRHHQIASRLASDYTVFFIEPTYSFLTLAKKEHRDYFLNSFRTRREKSGLTIVPGPVVLPYRNSSILINKINQRLLSRWIRRRIKDILPATPIVWFTSPNDCGQIGIWGDSLSIYDCYDEHTEWQQAISQSKVRQMEALLFAKVDIVFASARLLADKARQYRAEVVNLPNAVDEAVFADVSRQIDFDNKINEARSEGRPIVGYIGAVAYWLDYELIRACAESMPEALFVFVGPAEGDIPETVRGTNNIVFTGKKEPALVPAYINIFSVGLIPFQVNELTRKVNPLKAYEYLAKGKPVVGTDLPELAGMEGLISIGRDHSDFMAKLKEAVLEKRSNEVFAKRIEFAKRNTWAERLKVVRQTIQAALTEKQTEKTGS